MCQTNTPLKDLAKSAGQPHRHSMAGTDRQGSVLFRGRATTNSFQLSHMRQAEKDYQYELTIRLTEHGTERRIKMYLFSYYSGYTTTPKFTWSMKLKKLPQHHHVPPYEKTNLQMKPKQDNPNLHHPSPISQLTPSSQHHYSPPARIQYP
ncbi:hypothetical protein BDR22DRAFT_89286 [Usnea florida]